MYEAVNNNHGNSSKDHGTDDELGSNQGGNYSNNVGSYSNQGGSSDDVNQGNYPRGILRNTGGSVSRHLKWSNPLVNRLVGSPCCVHVCLLRVYRYIVYQYIYISI